MKLSEFISETLRQLIDGVVATQDYAREAGAEVNYWRSAFGRLPGAGVIARVRTSVLVA
jgi:hypothetical protein